MTSSLAIETQGLGTDRAAALARVGAIIEEPRFHRHRTGRIYAYESGLIRPG